MRIFIISLLIIIGRPVVASGLSCSQQNRDFRQEKAELFVEEINSYWQGQRNSFWHKNALQRFIRTPLSIGKHGAKLMFAEHFVLFDIPLSAMRARRSQVRMREFFAFSGNHRYLLMPVDILQRNGVHLLGKVLILAFFNAIDPYEGIDVNEVKATSKSIDNLAANEVILFVSSSNKNLLAYTKTMRAIIHKKHKNVAIDQLPLIVVDSGIDLIEQIGKVAATNTIREVHSTIMNRQDARDFGIHALERVIDRNFQPVVIEEKKMQISKKYPEMHTWIPVSSHQQAQSADRDLLQKLGNKMAQWNPRGFAIDAHFFIHEIKNASSEFKQTALIELSRGDYVRSNNDFLVVPSTGDVLDQQWSHLQQNFKSPHYWQQEKLVDTVNIESIGVPAYLFMLMAASYESLMR